MGLKKYSPMILIDVYRAALSGVKRSRLAGQFGVDKRTFKLWMKRHPELKNAVDQGYGCDANRPFAGGKQSFKDYGLTYLPESLRGLWKQLCGEAEKESSEQRFDALMEDQGKAVKQQIFLFSLVTCNFNKLAAMRRACINHRDVDRWKKDPQFAALIDRVHEMKKDFIEGALFNLIAGGDTSATVFAAKTQLRDRGYGDHKTIEHTGGTTVKKKVLGKVIHSLDVAGKRKLLKALRKSQEPKALPPRVVKSEDA